MNSIIKKNSNVYLMGFMGCGKTKIGTVLAKQLGRRFIDTDEQIVEENGKPIVEIFEKEGETYFRLKEKDLIDRVSKLSGCIVSLGGGTVINPENWRKITGSGITIALSYPPEIIASRLERKKDRPLINQYQGAERIQRISALMEVRNPYYQQADMVLHLNKEVEPECIVKILLEYLQCQA